MKAGGLVPDDMILRLISNELTQRGWISSGHPAGNILTLASSAMSTAEPTGASSFQDAAEMAAFLSSPAHAHGAAYGPPRVNEDPSASFLLDGFPRTAAQAGRLDDIVPINLAVSIKTPLEVIMQRIGGRWVHEPSGRVYNTTFNAPRVEGRDDVTGEPLVQRDDDQEETVKKRLAVYHNQTEVLLGYYNKWAESGLPGAPKYRKISGVGPVEQVREAAFAALSE